MNIHRIKHCSLILGLLLGVNAWAEDVDCNGGKEVKSAEWFSKCMHSAESQAPAGSSGPAAGKRSLSFEEAGGEETRSLGEKKLDAAVPPVKEVAKQRAKETPTSISLELLFDYNSANLTAAAKEQLKGFAQAFLKEPDKKLTIEGHTDAVGSDSYNQSLSQQRAEAVKKFLTEAYSIPPSQIRSEGKGKNNLAKPNDPAAEENRRVIFFVSHK